MMVEKQEVNHLQSKELTALITAIANALADRISLHELNLLAVIFTQLGDTLATIATHRDILEPKKE